MSSGCGGAWPAGRGALVTPELRFALDCFRRLAEPIYGWRKRTRDGAGGAKT